MITRIAASICLLALCSCVTLPVENGDTYYPNGLDRNDGMSAGFMRSLKLFVIAGVAYNLADCSDEILAVCLSSEYMTFAYPKDQRIEWRVAGYDFKKTVVRPIFDMGVNELVEVIESSQSNHKFLFYYSKSSGLVGWDIFYTDQDGKPKLVRYFRNRHARIPGPQSNNSFKPSPLRGLVQVQYIFTCRRPQSGPA